MHFVLLPFPPNTHNIHTYIYRNTLALVIVVVLHLAVCPNFACRYRYVLYSN